MAADEDKTEDTSSELTMEIFESDEAMSNFVGLFNAVLQIDRRLNPDLYD